MRNKILNRNFTIISGDSRGKVSVWNAEQASLIKVLNRVLTCSKNNSL